MSPLGKRLLAAAALTLACGTGSVAAVPAAQAAGARPSDIHVHDDGYDGPWRPWRFVADYPSAFLCNGQGVALLLSGGAREYRCEADGGTHELYIR
ncbi:hypothetical protein ACSNOI_24205 [Actinomadura kijaniata]|uniref:hypothetical protein n=1 Tax=Actinomadura kijaniata TaxID=46161 RepID=UPI003F1A5E1F